MALNVFGKLSELLCLNKKKKTSWYAKNYQSDNWKFILTASSISIINNLQSIICYTTCYTNENVDNFVNSFILFVMLSISACFFGYWQLHEAFVFFWENHKEKIPLLSGSGKTLGNYKRKDNLNQRHMI